MSTNWPPRDWIRLDQLLANGAGVLGGLHAAGTRWPITIEAERPLAHSSWLTSVTAALVATPRDEIARADIKTWQDRALLTVLDHLTPLAARMGLGRAIIVNNTLLSVSLVGPAQIAGLTAALGEAARRWPDRFVFARGIVSDLDDLRERARALGGIVLPNRVCHVFDLRAGKLPEKINAVRDATLLRKSKLAPMTHNDFTAADVAAAHAQYLDLYVARHGAGNPAFTLPFFTTLHARGAVEFIGLRSGDTLAAFAALADHGDFLSVPLIGYRADVDRSAGLYRQIFAKALAVAAERRRVINFGAGAGRYKALRGATAAVERMILIPPRTTLMGRALRHGLTAAERPLERWVPKTIAAFGG